MLSTEFRHDDVPLSQPPATHWSSSSTGLLQFWSHISIVSKGVLSSEAVHILSRVREVDSLFWRGGRLILIEVSLAAKIKLLMSVDLKNGLSSIIRWRILLANEFQKRFCHNCYTSWSYHLLYFFQKKQRTSGVLIKHSRIPDQRYGKVKR